MRQFMVIQPFQPFLTTRQKNFFSEKKVGQIPKVASFWPLQVRPLYYDYVQIFFFKYGFRRILMWLRPFQIQYLPVLTESFNVIKLTPNDLLGYYSCIFSSFLSKPAPSQISLDKNVAIESAQDAQNNKWNLASGFFLSITQLRVQRNNIFENIFGF